MGFLGSGWWMFFPHFRPRLISFLIINPSAVTYNPSIVWPPVHSSQGVGALPSSGLLGMCRWMGSHVHDWTDYNGSINSKCAHPPLPPKFVGHFSTSPSSRWGICQRRSARGWGIVKNNSVFQTLKVAYGSTPICANICTILSTWEQEMTKRKTCTVHKKVAVLAVTNDLSYYRSYKNT